MQLDKLEVKCPIAGCTWTGCLDRRPGHECIPALLAARNAKVQELENELLEKRTLEGRLAEKSAKVLELEGQLVEKCARISTLEAQLAGQSARNATLETRFATQSVRVCTLEAQLRGQSASSSTECVMTASPVAEASMVSSPDATVARPSTRTLRRSRSRHRAMERRSRSRPRAMERRSRSRPRRSRSRPRPLTPVAMERPLTPVAEPELIGFWWQPTFGGTIAGPTESALQRSLRLRSQQQHAQGSTGTLDP